MVYGALSDKTYLSLGLLSPLTRYIAGSTHRIQSLHKRVKNYELRFKVVPFSFLANNPLKTEIVNQPVTRYKLIIVPIEYSDQPGLTLAQYLL